MKKELPVLVAEKRGGGRLLQKSKCGKARPGRITNCYWFNLPK